MVEAGQTPAAVAPAQDCEGGVVEGAGEFEGLVFRGFEEAGSDDADGGGGTDEGKAALRGNVGEGSGDALLEGLPGFGLGGEAAGDPGADDGDIAGTPLAVDGVGGIGGELLDLGVFVAEGFVDGGEAGADIGVDGVEIELIPAGVNRGGRTEGGGGLALALEGATDDLIEVDAVAEEVAAEEAGLVAAEVREAVVVETGAGLAVPDQVDFPIF